MILTELRVSGYRSIRDVRLPLGRVNVLVGPNGCGKSNLYQAVVLLAAAARGELARTIVEEGGMPSVLWAGPAQHKDDGARVALGVTLEAPAEAGRVRAVAGRRAEAMAALVSYDIELGIPPPGSENAFPSDPRVKTERLVLRAGAAGSGGRGPRRGAAGVVHLDRKPGSVILRDAGGSPVVHPLPLAESEAALALIREPHAYPEIGAVAAEIAGWRFYHQFRTDAGSPMRQARVATRTPVLAADGADLAAALRTIEENGDGPALHAAVARAFGGARLLIDGTAGEGRFAVAMSQPGLNRPLTARELSDGTLRYLCLLAALLSPQPPSVLALNEPESSLHPDLTEPLAALLAVASERSQLWITTHSTALAEAVAKQSGAKPIRLEKTGGETRLVGMGLLGWVEDDDE